MIKITLYIALLSLPFFTSISHGMDQAPLSPHSTLIMSPSEIDQDTLYTFYITLLHKKTKLIKKLQSETPHKTALEKKIDKVNTHIKNIEKLSPAIARDIFIALQKTYNPFPTHHFLKALL